MSRKLDGGCALFWGRGAGSPSNTKSSGPRPTYIPSGILIHPAVWPQWTWGGCAPFWGAGSPSNTKSPGPRPTSAPNGILIHPAIWPQWTWVENWGGLGPHLTQCGWGRGLPACQVHLDPSNLLATIHQGYRQADRQRSGRIG